MIRLPIIFIVQSRSIRSRTLDVAVNKDGRHGIVSANAMLQLYRYPQSTVFSLRSGLGDYWTSRVAKSSNIVLTWTCQYIIKESLFRECEVVGHNEKRVNSHSCEAKSMALEKVRWMFERFQIIVIYFWIVDEIWYLHQTCCLISLFQLEVENDFTISTQRYTCVLFEQTVIIECASWYHC